MDWGSFAGGVIGAFAAFLAAWFVYRKQSRNQNLSLRMKSFVSIRRIVDGGITALQTTQNRPFNDMLAVLDSQLIRPLEQLMPTVAEAGPDLYQVIFIANQMVASKLRNSVTEVVWADEDFRASDSSIILANDIRQACRETYLRMVHKTEALRDEHPWHRRMMESK